ncbi:MAG: hypothetical protein WAX89_08030, partial [Alphaproteobacteria bacterium]
MTNSLGKQAPAPYTPPMQNTEELANTLAPKLAYIQHLNTGRKRWRLVALLAIFFLCLGWLMRHPWGAHMPENTPHIARVDISGMILSNDFALDVLSDMAKDENVKAVLVNIDSPG